MRSRIRISGFSSAMVTRSASPLYSSLYVLTEGYSSAAPAASRAISLMAGTKFAVIAQLQMMNFLVSNMAVQLGKS